MSRGEMHYKIDYKKLKKMHDNPKYKEIFRIDKVEEGQ